MDEATFSLDKANGPESKTKLCFVEFARWRHQRRSSLSTIALPMRL